MLENPTPTPASAAAPPPLSSQPDSSAVIKRYAPPNQRNRSLHRRKSGEKNQLHATSRNIPALDHIDAGSNNFLNENSRPRLISIEGCCRSEMSQILNDQRPVMYSGSTASAWGHFRLPHQYMPQANSGGPSSGPQMDFLSELRRAIRNASSNSDN